MPIYEYFCSNCKRKFELLRPMSQAEETGECPNCGESAERVPSLFRKNSEGDSSSASACSTCAADICRSCPT